MENVRDSADRLPERTWKTLERPLHYQRKAKPRQRPDNVKDEIVRRHQFEVLRLQSEEVAEFNYQPNACREPYRMASYARRSSMKKSTPYCSRKFDTSSI